MDTLKGQDVCEYTLLANLSSANDIESLDLALEAALSRLFDSSDIDLNCEDSLLDANDESIRHLKVENVVHDIVRDILVVGARRTPRARLLDAIFEIYTNHYDLLLKCQLDRLTGLYNRQVLDEKINSLNRSVRYANQRTREPNRVIALFDIDHFKRINDTYGHLYGDEILVLVSHMMKTAFRHDDWLFRYGGEEFLVILNEISIHEAKQVIQRFVQQVANHSFSQVGQVTVSAGYTQYEQHKAFSATLDEADKALYFAKNNGRNQFHDYSELVEKDLVEAINLGSDIDLF